MSDVSFPHDGSDITVVAGAQPRSQRGPDDGCLRITWDAGPPRLVLAGDIDPATHTALIAALATAATALARSTSTWPR
ncbi:MAG: hypothetical protein WAK82_38330 [Streptosporangiaceae bacterium]